MKMRIFGVFESMHSRNLVPRVFSSTIFKMADRRSAILKIVEEKALGTRLCILVQWWAVIIQEILCKNGRLIPTAKRGKEIKQRWN